jgi:hypothetical protein
MVRELIGRVKQIEPSAFSAVEHFVDAGYCLMISSPEWTADALGAAGGNFKRLAVEMELEFDAPKGEYFFYLRFFSVRILTIDKIKFWLI